MDVPGLTSSEWRSGSANVAMEFLATQRHRTADGDRTLAHALEVEPGDLVVDVGCGTGEMVERLTHLHTGVTVIGLDVTPGLLEVGRRGSPAAAWVCAQADALPFGRQTVDRVLVQRLLLHLPQWRGVVAEVARVLRPGGILVISEPTWARFEFVSDDPELDVRLVALMQSGVAVPDIGEQLTGAARSVNLRVLKETWVTTRHPIDVSRYGRLAAQLGDDVPRGRIDQWTAGWQAPSSHIVSHVRRLVATPG